jgi:uncharacterized protein (DUF983 family)
MRMIRGSWRAAVLGRCPACGQGALFTGYYANAPVCSHCGTRYETSDGAWLGAIVFGYAIGAAFALLAIFAEVAWGPLRSLGLHPMWSIAIASVVVTAAAYRPAKGLWFALLYAWGFMSTPSAGEAGGGGGLSGS